MIAFMIDPFERSVQQVTVKGKSARHVAELIGCDFIESAARFDNGDVIYVNEEGLLLDDLYETQQFFIVRGYAQPFAGKGVVLGTTKGGNCKDACSTMHDILYNIRWITQQQAAALRNSQRGLWGIFHLHS